MNIRELQQYLIPAVALQQIPIERIPFSLPSLNLITGGGVPIGMMSDLVGVQGSGKTSLSLDLVAQAQKVDVATIYVDQERTFCPDYAQTIGVGLDRLLVLRAGSMEETLSAIELILRSQRRTLIVLDSVTWLVPAMSLDAQSTVDVYDTEQRIGEHAKKLGLFCKRVTPLLALHQNTILFINQYRANISTMARIDKKPAGSYVYHHALSLRLELVLSKKGEHYDEITMTVTKNKTHPARKSATVKLLHGKGFDWRADVLSHALRLGLVDKRGSWYVDPTTGEKVQGEIEAMQQLVTAELADRVRSNLAREVNQ